MFSVKIFYFSRILGNKIYSPSDKSIGKLTDLLVDVSLVRPMVVAAKVVYKGKTKYYAFTDFSIEKYKGQYVLECNNLNEIEAPTENIMSLKNNVLDRQLVDIDGRKLVRVNDLRLAVLSNGTYLIAVDVGIEGLLRRLGVAKPLKAFLKLFKASLPSQLILWDEVATVDYSHSGIKLSKKYTKLSTLHPSDLADILEDLDRNAQLDIFSSLDENVAADVLEEMEPDAQVELLERLSLEKAADVLDLLPADEVADILDEMEEEKAQALLSEMDKEASEEVRELMEYPDNCAGSLMSTEFISFNKNLTVEETLTELRKLKPDADTIYYLYVLDDERHLTATVSLRDIVVSSATTKLSEIMNEDFIFVYDYDKVSSIAEIISKYSLLALPVVDEEMVLVGLVVIDDVVHNLIKSKRR